MVANVPEERVGFERLRSTSRRDVRLGNLEKQSHLREWEYRLEADPRHNEIWCASMGFQACSKEVTTRGVEEDDENRDSTQYQSLTVRVANPSLERPEVLHAVKEVSLSAEEPTQAQIQENIKIYPEASTFGPEIPVTSSSNHSGSSATGTLQVALERGKSKSDFVALLEKHCASASSKTQSVIPT